MYEKVLCSVCMMLLNTCSCVKPKLEREEVIDVGGEGSELVGSDSCKILDDKILDNNIFGRQHFFIFLNFVSEANL